MMAPLFTMGLCGWLLWSITISLKLRPLGSVPIYFLTTLQPSASTQRPYVKGLLEEIVLQTLWTKFNCYLVDCNENLSSLSPIENL